MYGIDPDCGSHLYEGDEDDVSLLVQVGMYKISPYERWIHTVNVRALQVMHEKMSNGRGILRNFAGDRNLFS